MQSNSKFIDRNLKIPDYMIYFLKRFGFYLEFEKNYSIHTQNSYLSDVYIFLKFCLREDIYFISADKLDLLSFFAFLRQKKNITKNTHERKLSSLRTFYLFLSKKGIIENFEIKDFPFPNQSEEKLMKHIPNTKVDFVLENFHNKNSNFLKLRDRAILEFLYSTGVRVSELVYLKRQDFINSSQVKVRGKRKKTRIVFLGEQAKESMKQYLECKQQLQIKTNSIFVNSKGLPITVKGIQYIIRQRAKENGMSNLSPHNFRHTFATDLLNSGADIRAVQEFLGHESVKTTQKYLNISIDDLKKTYWRTHPHARKD